MPLCHTMIRDWWIHSPHGIESFPLFTVCVLSPRFVHRSHQPDNETKQSSSRQFTFVCSRVMFCRCFPQYSHQSTTAEHSHPEQRAPSQQKEESMDLPSPCRSLLGGERTSPRLHARSNRLHTSSRPRMSFECCKTTPCSSLTHTWKKNTQLDSHFCASRETMESIRQTFTRALG